LQIANSASKVFAFLADLIFFQQKPLFEAVAPLSLDLAGLFGVGFDVASLTSADPLHLVGGDPFAHEPYDAINPWPVCRNLKDKHIKFEEISGQFFRLSRVTRGRCNDHNFRRFLLIFGEKIAVFLKNQCYDQNFA
jgi:hypothetical protein